MRMYGMGHGRHGLRGRRFESGDTDGGRGHGEGRRGGAERRPPDEDWPTADACDRSGEGPGRGSRRFFGRGVVKYALLNLLTREPMHGYQMMKELEEKSGGQYTPSPGSIYPTLQMLEDRALIASEERDGKKVYRITDEGRSFLHRKRREGDERGYAGADGVEPSEEEIRQWRRERFRRKLGLSENGYEALQKLMAAESAAGNDRRLRPELDALIGRLREQLETFLAGLPERASGSGEASDEPAADGEG